MEEDVYELLNLLTDHIAQLSSGYQIGGAGYPWVSEMAVSPLQIWI